MAPALLSFTGKRLNAPLIVERFTVRLLLAITTP
jgi:hypothetical protein